MAKIEAEVFVEDTLSGQSGVFALKTAEPHRKQEDGKWVTTARTFRTVKVSRDSGVDLSQFGKGDRVTVVGSEKTEVREWQGKKLYDLVVWADSVAPVQRGQQAASDQGWVSSPDSQGVPF